MSWLTMARNPEPEVMGDEEAVSAYDAAASQKHLDAIDNTLVELVLTLGPGGKAPVGTLLDLGCGPGRITMKIAARCPQLQLVGVDRSGTMLRFARRAAEEQRLAGRVFFVRADAARLGFPDGTFDFVLSNSVLHHLSSPRAVLEEMARVAKPDGTVLVRDLRRPSWLAFPFHVRWHGRNYSGAMRKLFEDSVRAAYTPEELAELLRASGMSKARIFLHKGAHMGFVYGTDSETCPAGVK
ncbi:MAG: methyltransferase domain-containing protein [Acidobacteria bacterium]|nr:methyltransferase domain-containing protein [Acidobacteriota bacterium]